MSDNIEYEFHRSNDSLTLYRNIYADAGPDAVGPLKRIECFVDDGWTADPTLFGSFTLSGSADDMNEMSQWLITRALKAGESL